MNFRSPEATSYYDEMMERKLEKSGFSQNKVCLWRAIDYFL